MSARCAACGKAREESAPVVCLVVWAMGLRRPHVICPGEDSDYTVCLADGCDSSVRFIAKAISGNQFLSRSIGSDWQLVHIVFADGQVARARATEGSLQ